MKQYTANHLYELLPQHIRAKDVEQGYPLRGLLGVIARQVGVVEDNIAQLYDNWFIETCEDWVVPYIGELIGYEAIETLDDPLISRSPTRDRILFPRRVVGKTLQYRARKGTLSVLEELAMDITGWVVVAVEFYGKKPVGDSLAIAQAEEVRRAAGIAKANDGSGNWVLDDLDNGDLSNNRTNVGLFVWRKRCHPVTYSPPNYVETQQGEYYTFSPLGNNTPLYTKIERRTYPGALQKLPIPISRQMFIEHRDEYYGEGKSMCIYLPESEWPVKSQAARGIQEELTSPMPAISVREIEHEILDEDKLRRENRPHFPKFANKIVVDPETGRFVFPARPRRRPGREPRVTFYSGFHADIGGGEYQRPLSANPDAQMRQTNCEGLKTTLEQAVADLENGTDHILIEISDSGLFLGWLPDIVLKKGQTLQIRAANRCRPVIWIVEKSTSLPDSLRILPYPGSCFILDGILVAGRGLHIDEPEAEIYVKEQKPSRVVIRHSTLVPGWLLKPDTEPVKSEEASIELNNTFVTLLIQRSIVGSISVAQQDVPKVDPSQITIEDSILDSTAAGEPAIYGEAVQPAYVSLTVHRSTVLGEVEVRELPLAENSIFRESLHIHNRQGGIIRYSYFPDGSQTPRRFRCQTTPINKIFKSDLGDRFGTPEYCRLDPSATNILEGGEYGGEMGVYYHLFDPLRKKILERCLKVYLPVDVEKAEIFFVD